MGVLPTQPLSQILIAYQSHLFDLKGFFLGALSYIGDRVAKPMHQRKQHGKQPWFLCSIATLAENKDFFGFSAFLEDYLPQKEDYIKTSFIAVGGIPIYTYFSTNWYKTTCLFSLFFKGGWRKRFHRADPTQQSTQRWLWPPRPCKQPPTTRPISAHCKQAISVAPAEDATTHYYELACMNSFFVPLTYVSLQGKCVSQARAVCQHCAQRNKSLLSKCKGTNNIKQQKQRCKAHTLLWATVVNIKKSVITRPLQYFVSGGRIF